MYLQKRWSSSRIIDKVIEYIPTVEKEIEKQKHKKEELIKAKEMRNYNNNNERVTAAATVSTHPLSNSGEVIIQICTNQKPAAENYCILFSSLIRKAEAEGITIIGASTVSVSGDHPTLTCHLHVQVISNIYSIYAYIIT